MTNCSFSSTVKKTAFTPKKQITIRIIKKINFLGIAELAALIIYLTPLTNHPFPEEVLEEHFDFFDL